MADWSDCRGHRGSRAALLWLLLAGAWTCCLAQPATVATLKADAQQAQRAGQDDRAASLYAQALEQDPAWTEGWWRYGGLLYSAHQFQAASVAFGHLTQLAPGNSLGFALLGMCEYELGDSNNASLHLNKALVHGGLPQTIADGAMYDYGLALMRQKNRNGALIAFRLLQHNTPQYPNLVPAIGSAELGLEQMPAVETPNAGAVSLAGQAGVAVLDLKTADAERFYRQLVQEYPRLPYAHLCLALFLENLGRQVEAEQELKAETSVNHDTPDAWIWLGRLALARRDGPATRSDVEQALKLSPNDGVCYLLSGRSYVVDQQWDKALPDLQKAEALSPDSYEVHFALVSVYSALHDTEEAASERKLAAKTYAIAHPARDGR